jgi:hypothetical protein
MEPSMHRNAVISRSIRSVGFDPGTHTLQIEFRSGAVYDFADVPHHVFDELMHAPSKGRYFQERVRDHFVSLRLGDIPLADIREETREDTLLAADEDPLDDAPSPIEEPAGRTSRHSWVVDVIEDDSAAIQVDGRQVTPIPRWLLPASARVNDRLHVVHRRTGDRSELTIELERDH